MKYFLLAILYTVSACSIEVTIVETPEYSKFVANCIVVDAKINLANAIENQHFWTEEHGTISEKEIMTKERATNFDNLALLKVSQLECMESIAVNGNGGFDVTDLWQPDA